MDVQVPEYDVQESMELRSEDAVLLVVDMQKDFVHEDGSLYNPEAEETVPVLRDLIETTRSSGVPVWYTKDTHTENDPEFEVWGEHCLEDSWGWEIVDPLKPDDDDRVFLKSRYDGFYGTELDHQLNLADRDTLIITGTVANICVHYTAASAGLRYYDVIHPVDAISALTEFDYHAALRQATFLFQAELVKSSGLALN
ncbi:MAG: cysteine hydrolase family protein [bacterium]